MSQQIYRGNQKGFRNIAWTISKEKNKKKKKKKRERRKEERERRGDWLEEH